MNTVANASRSEVRNDAALPSAFAASAASSGEEGRIGHVSCRRSSGDPASLATRETTMNTTSSASRIDEARFELRYRSLSPHRCGFAFPCDAHGRVNLDDLSELARENYLYARAMVGRDLLQPQVLLMH